MHFDGPKLEMRNNRLIHTKTNPFEFKWPKGYHVLVNDFQPAAQGLYAKFERRLRTIQTLSLDVFVFDNGELQWAGTYYYEAPKRIHWHQRFVKEEGNGESDDAGALGYPPFPEDRDIALGNDYHPEVSASFTFQGRPSTVFQSIDIGGSLDIRDLIIDDQTGLPIGSTSYYGNQPNDHRFTMYKNIRVNEPLPADAFTSKK